jgi:hypothetical protein
MLAVVVSIFVKLTDGPKLNSSIGAFRLILYLIYRVYFFPKPGVTMDLQAGDKFDN